MIERLFDLSLENANPEANIAYQEFEQLLRSRGITLDDDDMTSFGAAMELAGYRRGFADGLTLTAEAATRRLCYTTGTPK